MRNREITIYSDVTEDLSCAIKVQYLGLYSFRKKPNKAPDNAGKHGLRGHLINERLLKKRLLYTVVLVDNVNVLKNSLLSRNGINDESYSDIRI